MTDREKKMLINLKARYPDMVKSLAPAKLTEKKLLDVLLEHDFKQKPQASGG